MNLEDILTKHHCDKSTKHKYHEVYGPEFDPIRDDQLNLLEVGIFRGESFRAWVDYFPNSTIYGIDIFTRIQPSDIEDILGHERVRWAKANSLITKIEDVFPGVEFDIVIDDGMHTPRANMLTFKNAIGSVKKTGAYYVEDVFPLDIMTEEERSIRWLLSKPDEYNLQRMKHFNNAISKYKQTHFDNREKSGEPDSYIIKLEHLDEEA